LASAALHAVLLGHMCFQPAASSTTVQVHCICHDELHIVLLMQPSIMLCSPSYVQCSNARCLVSAALHAVQYSHDVGVLAAAAEFE